MNENQLIEDYLFYYILLLLCDFTINFYDLPFDAKVILLPESAKLMNISSIANAENMV